MLCSLSFFSLAAADADRRVMLFIGYAQTLYVFFPRAGAPWLVQRHQGEIAAGLHVRSLWGQVGPLVTAAVSVVTFGLPAP